MYVLAKLHLYILYTIQYGNTMYQRHYMYVRNNVRITESSREYNYLDKIMSNISCSFIKKTHVYICTYVTGLVKTRHNSGNLFFT